jgi:lysophospholipase L1-like esterase
MVQENFLLFVFVVVPAALLLAIYLFFGKSQQHARKTLRWPRLIAGNMLVFLFLCSVVVFCGEVYYRFFFDTTESFGLTKHTQRWFRRHFRLNASGFRDSVPVYHPRAAPGQRRVSFLGDSFTAGHGIANVQDRFANRFRAVRPDCEVHVFAQIGWDTGHELENLKRSANAGYELDLLVLVYCLNDISDIAPDWQIAARRIYASSDPGYLVAHSFFFNTLYFRWKAAHDPDVSNYYQFVRNNYEGAVWEEQKQRLRALRDEVASRGGRLLVVTFPFLHALGPDYEYRQIHERLDRCWKELNVPHLDLLGIFESRPPAELTINRYDAHPNEQAHRMAAESIAAFLDKHLENSE